MPRNTSRRSLLAAFSAVPAATVAAALPLPVLAHPAAPDAMSAEAAELTRLYDATRRRTVVALAACEKAEARYVRPPPPEVLFQQPDDPLLRSLGTTRRDGRPWYGDPDRIDILRGWDVDKLRAYGWRKQLDRRAEILAAHQQWEDQQEAAKDAAGVTATDAEYRAAWRDEEVPVRNRILALRLADPAALALKVRVYLDSVGAIDWRAHFDDMLADAVEREGGPWEDAFAASIIRDIVMAYAPAEA